MFGNLFEEEEEDEGFSMALPGARMERGKEAEPPPPRGAVKLCGIKNQGGTCYLNSLLQTLLFTPEFREELFSLGPEELGCLGDKDKPEAKVRVIPLELQRLFASLLLVDQQTASTTDLTDSFGWTGNEESRQQDVQELNRILFSALESSLVGTTGSDLIHRLYHGIVVNQIVCKECSNVSEREEDFLDLTVSVSGVSGLEEALWNMFVEEEVFEGNNLYRCSRCEALVRAAKSAKLRKLPPFLTVSLLRFNFDFTKCERYKETGRYTFPFTINIKPFCEKGEHLDSDYTYELFSVIIHKGGCYGGHYHVYINDIDALGNWDLPEEDSNSKLQKTETPGTEPVVEKDDPLSVITAILSQEESKGVLVDQLGQKLLDKIGISWSKKFRKQYGPIGKFLQCNSDVFVLISNGTRVALKPTTVVTAPEAVLAAKPENTALREEHKHHLLDGRRWFDFNDSTVTPIREKDIEKQFQGKESAYMLFYRKAELHRPEEAKRNAAYKVPSHLLQMVREENAILQQRRQEFDSSTNTIEIHLHLAPQYTLDNGALQPKGLPQEATISITFDRRKTVGDLRLAVYQMQDLWEGDMALTVARSLPAGLHLYNTLSDDQQSLYSAGVVSGSNLFVWNGREVCGLAVQMGSEYEPILLTLLGPPEDVVAVGDGIDAGPGLSQATRSFPRAITLGAVRVALGGPEDTLLCQEESRPGSHGGGASGWKVFSPADMHRTLKELALKDGDALLVLEPQALDCSLFSLNGDTVTVTTPSDCRWLHVEFHPHKEVDSEEKEAVKRKGKVSASGNTLLSEVKLSAIEELHLQEQVQGMECCLRQVDRSGKLLPPVCEDLSVREARVKLMTSLFLCPGAAPGPTQLFLYFTVDCRLSHGAEMEIIVDEAITVKECLRLMVQAAGVEGEAWHLRKTDWCGDVGDPLTDEAASLAELKISSGDALVVTEGRLPPKGFLKLPIWLLMQSNGVHISNGLGNQEFVAATEKLGGEMHFVGNVEISVEASLDDLKIQVLTLPLLQDLYVPTTAFLRVWLLEGKKLSKILRGNQQPLTKIKLENGTELCLQRLVKEENLGPKELLLQVKVGVPGERDYYPSEELIWDTSRDASPRALRQTIAVQYSLCADSLHIAKYCPDMYMWMPISNWNQQVSKRKKKKKGENLQAAPFYLKDGDIIGVKNLQIDNNRNFNTVQDELGQERLRQEAENHKSGRGQIANSAPSVESGQQKKAQKKTRKPEVALSINVGVFR